MEYNDILIYLCTLTVFLIQIGAFIYGFWKKQKPVMYNKGKLIKYMDLYFVYYPQKKQDTIVASHGNLWQEFS